MDELNMYFVINKKNPNGGRFYNIYVNEGEKLDLSLYDTSDIDDFYETVKKDDPTFKKAGGLIIKSTKTIGSLNIYTSGTNISAEEQEAYDKWLELDSMSNKLYDQLTEIQKEKNQLSKKIKTKKRG